MRTLFLALAASSLALTGCGKKQATGNTSAIDDSLSAQEFASNDATAIDAATGADANMAADVDINVVENEDNVGSSAVTPSAKARDRSESNSSNSAEPAAAPAEPAPTESNAT